jgi:ribosomal protein RSM22 (predicted rRNA methylase)
MNTALVQEVEREVEALVGEAGLARVRQAAAALGAQYARGQAPRAPAWADVLAYAAMRLPGTVAALERVARELAPALAATGPLRVLDVCSGPGTGFLALRAAGLALREVVCVEDSAQMIELGRRLVAAAGGTQCVTWHGGDVERFLRHDTQRFDLAIIAYGLGELAEPRRGAVLDALWQRVVHAVVVVEPGTPAGAARVREVRDAMVRAGGRILAPCPHGAECPLAGGQPQWCHFAVRIGRSRLSRLVDSGSASFEDEKYSYVIGMREGVPPPVHGRVVGHPRLVRGGVQLAVCLAGDAFRRAMVPKRAGEAFRLARKLRWGDALPAGVAAALTGAELE